MSDIYPHYRNISNQYNQEDQTGIEEINTQIFLFSAFYLIVFGQYSPCHMWATSTSTIITMNYRQFEEIQQVWMKLRLRFFFFWLLFCVIWARPSQIYESYLEKNHYLLNLPFSSNGQFPNEIIWFQSHNNKFTVFVFLGKISAPIFQEWTMDKFNNKNTFWNEVSQLEGSVE